MTRATAGLLVVALLLGALAAYGLHPAGPKRDLPAVGKPAPPVALEDLATREKVSLPTDFQGRPFALIFFSHGSPPSREQVLQLRYARRELEERVFDLVIVSEGTVDDLAFLGRTGHRVLLDPDHRAFTLYRVTAVPRTFHIDRMGVIRKDTLGWTRNSLKQFLETALELVAP